MLAALHLSWYLLPLSMVISLVYSASRYELPEKILTRALGCFCQIVGSLAAVFAVLWLLSYDL